MLYSIQVVRKKLGVSAQTIRNYIKQGKIEATQMPNGRFYFTSQQIKAFLNASQVVNAHNNEGNQPVHGVWAYYLRSSDGNKTHLSNQEEVLKGHYPAPLFIFKDAGSGLNEKRAGLWRLLEKAKQGEITDVAITQADRLSRFGNTYLLELFKTYGVEVHFLYEQQGEGDSNLYGELMKDFMALIASFSGKFYKLRSLENKMKLLSQAQENLQTKEREDGKSLA